MKRHVEEHTRKLANGRQVTVNGHQRDYTVSTESRKNGEPQDSKHGAPWRGTTVQQHRKARLQQQARVRRAEAAKRGKAASRRGWEGTRKRARRSWRVSKRGGKHLKRAWRAAGRKKKVTAGCLAAAGIAEITGALAYSTIGAAVTGVAILGATVSGGLLVGAREQRHEANADWTSNKLQDEHTAGTSS